MVQKSFKIKSFLSERAFVIMCIDNYIKVWWLHGSSLLVLAQCCHQNAITCFHTSAIRIVLAFLGRRKVGRRQNTLGGGHSGRQGSPGRGWSPDVRPHPNPCPQAAPGRAAQGRGGAAG